VAIDHFGQFHHEVRFDRHPMRATEAANPPKKVTRANTEARLYALSMTAALWLTVLLVPHTARVARSSTMQVRDSDFVRYAQERAP
jgi:ABC-type dipeptide/oligopeptide/nickel transport system permease subunit